MENIKAIFIDFDWTIFDHKSKSIPTSTIVGLNKAKAKGVKIFLNSARTYYSLKGKDIIDQVDFDGFGVINGCASFTKNEILHAHFLSEQDVEDIISIAKKNHLSYLMSTLENTYIDAKENDECVKAFYQSFEEPYPLDISLYKKKDPIIAIQVFYREDKDYLYQELANKLEVNRFFEATVEFNKCPSLKQEATSNLIEHFHLKKEDCMALGDDINDIDMFHSVKYSVCMGNGNAKAKENALYITSNIEDDGIYNALKHFKVI